MTYTDERITALDLLARVNGGEVLRLSLSEQPIVAAWTEHDGDTVCFQTARQSFINKFDKTAKIFAYSA